MARRFVLLMLCLAVAVGASACRIGGGFDSHGRLISNTKKATPEPASMPVEAAPKLATIYYLIPAG